MKRNSSTVRSPGLSQSQTWLVAKPLLGRLVKWTVLAVLALTLAVVALYVLGSYRRASAESQLALVRLSLALSMLLIISSMYGLILNIYYLFTRFPKRRPDQPERRKRGPYIAGIPGYLLLITLGASIVLVAAFILGAVGGNR